MTHSIQIRGILLAIVAVGAILLVPAFSHAESNVVAKSKPTKDLSCVQTAVAEREAAIAESWTAYSTAMVAALTTRTEALTAAWGETDSKERSSELKSLWKTWKSDSKKAHSDLKNDRKDAWKVFKKTVKEECGTSSIPKEDPEPKDMKGEVAI